LLPAWRFSMFCRLQGRSCLTGMIFLCSFAIKGHPQVSTRIFIHSLERYSSYSRSRLKLWWDSEKARNAIFCLHLKSHHFANISSAALRAFSALASALRFRVSYRKTRSYSYSKHLTPVTDFMASLRYIMNRDSSWQLLGADLFEVVLFFKKLFPYLTSPDLWPVNSI
jgi:hypothetical protein